VFSGDVGNVAGFRMRRRKTKGNDRERRHKSADAHPRELEM
jgi:hypothetical protein